jgi:hypothetical protein
VRLEKVTSRIARWGRLLFLPDVGCSRCALSCYKVFVSACLAATFCSITPLHAAGIELSSDSEIATAGYYQLSWTTDTSQDYQLQESASEDFQSYKTIYQGPDQASVISGKPDGVYFYRIVGVDSQPPVSSNTLKVSVAHHSLTDAFLFFTAGAMVFIAILVLIIKGSRESAAS